MLSSIKSYSWFVYSLLDDTAIVSEHAIRIYPRGAWIGVLDGAVKFNPGVMLRVYERLDFARQRILVYSYEVWQHRQKLYWYDPQEHPNDPTLAATYPHHKHIPPDIKHHRIPAPELSFTRPNLPFLIREVERLLKG